ncbi:putative calcium-dependent phosphotriesterase protein [Fonsecaea pedrosoi]|nr:putative calcium-dependent phosphotriesterase protein [Fonsecaea pedrosoi]
MWCSRFIILATTGIIAGVVVAQKNSSSLCKSIPVVDTFFLPRPFSSNLTDSFVQTDAPGPTGAQIQADPSSPYICFDDEFAGLLQGEPVLAVNQSGLTAFEAGAWAPEGNAVWFSSAIGVAQFGKVQVFHLDNSTVTTPALHTTQTQLLPLANPNGGYYFNGTVYFVLAGSPDVGGSVVAINPTTFETDEIVNSYFGLQYPSLDDIALVPPRSKRHPHSCAVDGEVEMIFSCLDFNAYGYPLHTPDIPNSYWKFTPRTQTLRAVLDRADILFPNGVAFDKDFTTLYASETAYTATIGPSNSSTGFPGIYKYRLGDGCTPQDKELFAMARGGAPDGIKVDDRGRVWTIEAEGLVVRNPQGKVIGIFNRWFFLDGEPAELSMGNFALAHDKVVLLAFSKIWVVQLSEVVFSADRLSI